MLGFFLLRFVIRLRSALKGRGFSRVVIGDKENATLVAEGIFPCGYSSPFDAAKRQTLRYVNRRGTNYANEEHATYTAAFIEPMEYLPMPHVPEGADCTYEILCGPPHKISYVALKVMLRTDDGLHIY
jgi:hypothetical protein